MISYDQILNATMCKPAMVELFLNFINDTASRYQINTPERQLVFLAQLGHESAGLFYTEELASGEAYEGRKALGNTMPGDGVRFKGRGLIQITGRANYSDLSKAFNVDFISNPELLGGKNSKSSSAEQLKYSVLSAGWFWNTRQLNLVADKIMLKKISSLDDTEDTNLQAFISVTKKINGGKNGLEDRISRFNNGLPFFIN